MRTFSKLILIGAGLMMGALAFYAADKPDAETLYKQNCSMCHGVDGKGFSAIHTPDFTDPKWQAANKDKAMETIIKLGKKDTAMKGFGEKLKDAEIRAMVLYIRGMNSNKKKK